MDKEKFSKILFIASVALIIAALCTTFAPALNIEYYDNATGEFIGTGAVSSLFTVLFCFLKSTFTIHIEETGAVYEDSIKALRKSSLPYAISIAVLITVLVIIAIVTLVLFFTKKYQGKIKLIFSIAIWALLLVTVVAAFLSKEIFDLRVPSFHDGEVEILVKIKINSLGLAPILFGAFGALALGSSVASFILNRE